MHRRLAESFTGVRTVIANRDLRLLELAWAGSVLGYYGFQIGLGVYAYEVGGATAVGLMFLMRTLGAFATPPASTLADRYPRIRVMVLTDLVRVVLVCCGLLVVVVDGPSAAVYVVAAVVAGVGTAFRPAQVAVLPTLARTPQELTVANVLATTIEGLGMFAGPALAGLVLALSDVEGVFVLTAAAFLWSGVLLLPVKAPPPPPKTTASSYGEELLAGFRVTWRTPDLRVIVGVLSGQALTAGAINVLIVVTALSLLGMGQGGVGVLDAAVGAGSLLGAVLVLPLVTGRQLTAPFVAGALLWGLPLLAIAAWPEAGVAFLALGLVGIGNTLVDVAGFTLVQRIADDEVLGRVFGVVQSLFYLMIGAGSLLAPLFIETLGQRGTLVVTGLFLPVAILAVGRRVLRIDHEAVVPVHEIGVLGALPMFSPLSELALERLARQATALDVEPGTEVITEGEPGDRFYAIDTGRFDVFVDGRHVATLGPGEGFGEIALLRDQPRMATVVAAEAGRMYALDREIFLAAVTGQSESEEAANAIVVARLSASLGAGLAR